MTTSPPALDATRPPRWPWALLAVAMLWVALVRIPLALNAEVHLDSDLAVDGLTLRDAAQGTWRWHFPGTPHMGAAPILLALPGAWLFGANASTLVVGGVLAYEAVVLAAFLLAMRAFGPRVASWSLVPSAFASVGTVWLSGRLTGGHLLTVAWYAGALVLFHTCLTRGGAWRALGFGAWCGLGFSLDQMFLSALLPIAVVAFSFVGMGARIRAQALALVAFVVGFGVGDIPRELGYRADPYDAYREQFDTILVRHPAGPLEGQIDRAKVAELASEHALILLRDCLPRLIAGHRLRPPAFPTEPGPQAFAAGRRPPPSSPSMLAVLGTIPVALGLFLVATAFAARAVGDRRGPATAAVATVLLLTTGLVTVGFVLNRNIFNSDNYRYLVFWLVPWAVGFGLLMDALWKKGAGGRASAAVLSAALAGLMTADTAAWYRGFGWLDGLRPIRAEVRDPAYLWLKDHPEAGAIFGGYWDVYRLQFLLGGRVRGLPFPNYPDRFDEASRYPGRRPTLLVARGDELGGFYPTKAREDGGRVLFRDRDVLIIDWPLAP